MPDIQSKRNRVALAHRKLYDLHEVSAIERYFSPNFIEHSPRVTNGLAGLLSRVQSHPTMHYETHRVLADGDLVALHGRYTGWGAQALVGFDLYRIEDGLITEHWEGLVPEAPVNASGRSQLDGPIDPASSAHPHEKNRDLIHDFFTKTLIQEDYNGFRHATDGTHFLQHSPDIADGVPAVIDFLVQLQAEGKGLEYTRLHRSIADGQFVLTHSEGRIAGERHAFFELWRVENGQLVEMWDAIAPVPEDTEAGHSSGIF